MTAATAADLTQLTGQYNLDPTHTRIGFVARHAMVTKVRGSFNEFDAHLRGNDFFAMEEYPEITFASTSVEQVSPSEYNVTGDLTIKGTTRPVTVPFEFTGSVIDPWGNLRVGFEGSVVVNRKDWNVNWNAALEAGGVLVGEKVTLEFEVSAVKVA
jgi:polyisoprenoid-binding protein YceI